MTEPKLAKPGAGIPLPQMIFLRFYLGPFVAGRSNWEKNWQSFDQANSKILAAIERLSAEQLEKKVLVRPLRGLEDSSRYWSAAMTLEHLVITGTAFSAIIKELSQNRVPEQKASTAAVKPLGGKSGPEQLASFKAFLEHIRPGLEPVKNAALISNARYSHPWFGAFSALQWQWVIGAHTWLHYAQIKEIIKGL